MLTGLTLRPVHDRTLLGSALGSTTLQCIAFPCTLLLQTRSCTGLCASTPPLSWPPLLRQRRGGRRRWRSCGAGRGACLRRWKPPRRRTSAAAGWWTGGLQMPCLLGATVVGGPVDGSAPLLCNTCPCWDGRKGALNQQGCPSLLLAQVGAAAAQQRATQHHAGGGCASPHDAQPWPGRLHRA